MQQPPHINFLEYGFIKGINLLNPESDGENIYSKGHRFVKHPFSMKLDQFLKWHGLVATGGEAKHLISSGCVKVNGVVVKERGKKLFPGDEVCLGEDQLIVHENNPERL